MCIITHTQMRSERFQSEGWVGSGVRCSSPYREWKFGALPREIFRNFRWNLSILVHFGSPEDNPFSFCSIVVGLCIVGGHQFAIFRQLISAFLPYKTDLCIPSTHFRFPFPKLTIRCEMYVSHCSCSNSEIFLIAYEKLLNQKCRKNNFQCSKTDVHIFNHWKLNVSKCRAAGGRASPYTPTCRVPTLCIVEIEHQ